MCIEAMFSNNENNWLIKDDKPQRNTQIGASYLIW